uniref:EF-hand domain-containing protein n=1 Tax=Macrostomum lignano TaxID=282301 RepID=A0A1I8JNP0_9PLAT
FVQTTLLSRRHQLQLHPLWSGAPVLLLTSLNASAALVAARRKPRRPSPKRLHSMVQSQPQPRRCFKCPDAAATLHSDAGDLFRAQSRPDFRSRPDNGAANQPAFEGIPAVEPAGRLGCRHECRQLVTIGAIKGATLGFVRAAARLFIVVRHRVLTTAGNHHQARRQAGGHSLCGYGAKFFAIWGIWHLRLVGLASPCTGPAGAGRCQFIGLSSLLQMALLEPLCVPCRRPGPPPSWFDDGRPRRLAVSEKIDSEEAVEKICRAAPTLCTALPRVKAAVAKLAHSPEPQSPTELLEAQQQQQQEARPAELTSSGSSSEAQARRLRLCPAGCDIESVGPNGEVTWKRMPVSKKFNAYAEFPEFGRKGVVKLKEAFDEFDGDRDGYLGREDLTRMMERLGAPQTYLGLKALMRDFEAPPAGSNRLDFRGFLSMFRRAAAGQLDSHKNLLAWYAEYVGVEAVSVDEVGVRGAKDFFEAKIGIHAAGGQYEAELREEEQRQRQKKEEEDRIRQENFRAKRELF